MINSATYPLYQTAIFYQNSTNEFGKYDYTRSGNPTRHVLENELAKLEFGNYGYCFSTGMAAIDTIFKLLNCNDTILINKDIYGGTYRLITKLTEKYNIQVKFIDFKKNYESYFILKPKLVIIESLSNPLLEICDIRKLSSVCKKYNSYLMVDNSILSPVLCNPLLLGADIVMHSLSKIICGHSDTMGGVVITNNKEISDTIKFYQNAQGNALSPFDCWLISRGMKTMELRVKKQQTNALKIAKWLQSLKIIKNVYYPGLATHKNYLIHKKQTSGNGVIISFETDDNYLSEFIVNHTKIFKISVSFGSLTSLISLPSKMSHQTIPKDRRQFDNTLVRLSIGIENVKDLISDLRNAIILYLLTAT